jgi:hypothetical protein
MKKVTIELTQAQLRAVEHCVSTELDWASDSSDHIYMNTLARAYQVLAEASLGKAFDERGEETPRQEKALE